MTFRVVCCLVAILAIAAVAGCSHSGTTAVGGGGGAVSTAPAVRPSPAAIQAQISKVQANPNIPANQKAMMMGQMQRALAMQRPRPPVPQNIKKQ